MAFVVANRVKETSTTSGTGTLNLSGAVDGFQTFVDGVGTTNTTYYAIYDPSSDGWEVGIGTVTSGTPDTLSRDTVFESSNSGNLVNFGSTAKDVICTQPAESLARLDNDLNTNGNDIKFGDSDKATFGAGDDLQIYHDGAKSVIEDQGTGALQIRGTDLKLRSSAVEEFIECIANGAVTLYYDNSSKLATTSSGVGITGNITVSGTVDGRDIAADGATLDTALQNVSEDTTPQLGGDLDTNGNDVKFGDADKATFGAGNDLQIYHSSDSVYLDASNAPDYLFITTGTSGFYLMNPSFNILVELIGDGISLNHNSSSKLVTQSTGIDVTGTVVADGLTVDGDVLFDKTASGANKVLINASSGNNSRLVFCEGALAGEKYNIGFSSSDASFNIYHSAGAANRLKLQNNGDISFYDDAGTSEDFYWDASTSRLGLGTTTPSASLDVNGIARATNVQATASIKIEANNPQFHLVESDGPTDENFNMRVTGGNFQIRKADDALNSFTTRLQIDGGTGDLVIFADDGTSQDFYWDASTSRLGLGTTSPSQALDVNGSIASDISINAQTGTTYTTVLADRSKLVTLDNASAVTVTIPPNSSVAYPTGTKIDLLAKGAGQVTVAAGSGVTVNSSQTLNLRAQWSAASVVKLATDTWVLLGDLES
jgi:hypothetical protein